jgi:hypothetical protein
VESEIDDLLEGLKQLPAPALDAATARRVHQRARAALAGGRGAQGPVLAALVSSAVAGYLLWAVQFLAALAR